MIVFRDSQHETRDAAIASAQQIVSGRWWINYEPNKKRRFVIYSNSHAPEWRKRVAHVRLDELKNIVATSREAVQS